MLLNIFRTIFDWSEVWALLIPLTILLIYKPEKDWIAPVKGYLVTAFLLAIVIDFFWYVNKYDLFDSRKGHRWNNNIFYNIQSIARLLFFSWFFFLQGKEFRYISRIIPIIFLTGVILFFNIWGDFKWISSYLLATEAGFLLLYCLIFTNKIMREDKPAFASAHPVYWVVGGLTLYTSINFFIFLFYDYLNKNFQGFLVSIWDVHNILLILLCICIAIAFYNERKRK